MINKNDMMLLNDIIYKIHTIEDFDTMRKTLLNALNFLIPFQIATFYLASPDSPYELNRPVGIGMPEERWQLYLDQFQEIDYTRWTFAAPTANAYRETDLMNDEVRINTPFYKKMYAPAQIHYSAILTIIYEKKFHGCISLYRKLGEENFTDDEMLILNLLKDHLCYRLHKSLEKYQERTHLYPSKTSLMEQYDLTRREIEILYLLLDGVPRNTICTNLSISPNTLKKHTSNIYKKLNVCGWRELFKLMGSESKSGD